MDKIAKAAEKRMLIKTAAINFPTAGKVVGILAASLILSEFINRMFEWADRKGLEKAEPSHFKKMLEAQPQLLNEDPHKVMALWGSLYRTAPTFASDPIAAGAWITQSLHGRVMDDFGGPTLDTYKTLVDIESKKPTADPNKRFYHGAQFSNLMH